MSTEPGQIAYEAFMDESLWPYDFADVDGKIKAAWAAAEAAVRADATKELVEALRETLEIANRNEDGPWAERARAALEKARR